MWYENHIILVYWVVSTQSGCKHEEFIFYNHCFQLQSVKMSLIDISGRFHNFQLLWLIKVYFNQCRSFLSSYLSIIFFPCRLELEPAYTRSIRGWRERQVFSTSETCSLFRFKSSPYQCAGEMRKERKRDNCLHSVGCYVLDFSW